MKNIFSKSRIWTIVLILATLLAGCSADSADVMLTCPFTEAAWDYDFTAIDALEGGDTESYDSVYGGMTYTYPKEYMDKSGTIKYMFDGNDKLASVAWTYSSEDADEVMILYKNIYAAISDEFGKSSTEDGVQNYSEIWKRPEEGNIILSSVLTGDLKAVQIAFLHPSVSHE